MKLEFLSDISDGGRFKSVVSDNLIRLFDFNESEAIALSDFIQSTIINNKLELSLSSLDFIEPVNCDVTFRISGKDIGLTSLDMVNFFCDLTIDSYKEIIYLLEPFCIEANGYQWLYDLENEIDLLFSPDGTW